MQKRIGILALSLILAAAGIVMSPACASACCADCGAAMKMDCQSHSAGGPSASTGSVSLSKDQADTAHEGFVQSLPVQLRNVSGSLVSGRSPGTNSRLFLDLQTLLI